MRNVMYRCCHFHFTSLHFTSLHFHSLHFDRKRKLLPILQELRCMNSAYPNTLLLQDPLRYCPTLYALTFQGISSHQVFRLIFYTNSSSFSCLLLVMLLELIILLILEKTKYEARFAVVSNLPLCLSTWLCLSFHPITSYTWVDSVAKLVAISHAILLVINTDSSFPHAA
jgi:hypothetical protein